MRSEATALVLSAVAALILGVIGVGAALITNSQAILLDGLFNACYFVTALLTLRVAQLLKRPDDARFPFGYLYFEPLINAAKGMLMLGIASFALVDAALSILAGGRYVMLGGAIGYAAFATAICLGVTLLLRRMRRSVPSPLVDADLANWGLNAAISAAVFIAFCVAWGLIAVDLRVAARFVDPTLVGIVILVTLGIPVRMAYRSLMALLNRAPPETVVAAVTDTAHAALAGIDARRIYVRIVQPGRTIYALIHVLLNANHPPLTVQEADALRRSLVEALTRHHAPIVVDLVFTTEEKFAAPTAGFAAAPSMGQSAS